MTIIEVINKTDNLKPNNYTQQDKLDWLSELDGKLQKEIFDNYKAQYYLTYDVFSTNTLTITVNEDKFVDVLKPKLGVFYKFIYSKEEENVFIWKLNGKKVQLENYGITVSGTLTNLDSVNFQVLPKEFEKYTIDDLGNNLLVEFPYDSIYIHWLSSKIDFFNGEMNKYNNDIILYNDILTSFSNNFNKNNMPRGTKIKYF